MVPHGEHKTRPFVCSPELHSLKDQRNRAKFRIPQRARLGTCRSKRATELSSRGALIGAWVFHVGRRSIASEPCRRQSTALPAPPSASRSGRWVIKSKLHHFDNTQQTQRRVGQPRLLCCWQIDSSSDLKALSTLATVVAGNGDNLSPNSATVAENGKLPLWTGLNWHLTLWVTCNNTPVLQDYGFYVEYVCRTRGLSECSTKRRLRVWVNLRIGVPLRLLMRPLLILRLSPFRTPL